MKLEGQRPGVVNGFLRSGDLFDQEKRLQSYVLPTRYGKSDLQRLIFHEQRSVGRIGLTLYVAPNKALVRQFLKQSYWATFSERYDIDVSGYTLAELERQPLLYKGIAANGEDLVGMTTQLFCSLAGTLRRSDGSEQVTATLLHQLINHVNDDRHGTLLVLYDEGHVGRTTYPYGQALAAVTDWGGYGALFTATPERADGGLLPGFAQELVEVRPITIAKRRHDGELNEVVVDLYSASRKIYLLVPDFIWSFKQAWDEGSILQVSREPVDAEISLIDGQSQVRSQKKLSELTAREARENLNRIVRDPRVIDAAMTKFADVFRHMRNISRDVTALIFCGNDRQDDDKNAHGLAIKRVLARHMPELKIEVVTMQSDDDPGVTIAAYRDARAFDVLILKQMGGAGLDAAHCKLVCDLSAIRTVAACIQRWLRGATDWRDDQGEPLFRSMVLIYLQEAISEAIYATHIAAKGGEARLTTDLVYTETVPIDPDDEDRLIARVDSAGHGDLSDTEGNAASRSEVPWVYSTFNRYPGLRRYMSAAELAAAPKGNASLVPVNASSEIAYLRAQSDLMVHDITKLRLRAAGISQMNDGRWPPGVYGREIAIVWTELKELAGVARDTSVEDIYEIDVLRELYTEACAMRSRLEREGWW